VQSEWLSSVREDQLLRDLVCYTLLIYVIHLYTGWRLGSAASVNLGRRRTVPDSAYGPVNPLTVTQFTMSPLATPYDVLGSGSSDEAIAFIVSNPNFETIYQFTEAFEQLCTQYPHETDTFAAALSTTSLSDKISQFQIPGSDDTTNEALDKVFRREIYELIKRLLYAPAETSISSTNKYIVVSLISGVAIHTNLCNSHAQLAEIAQGLHFPRSNYRQVFSAKEDEIKALGACIQLLVAGPMLYDESEGHFKKQEIKERLTEVKRFMKHPTAAKVVEVRNSNSSHLIKYIDILRAFRSWVNSW
jgi:hypothetical protein